MRIPTSTLFDIALRAAVAPTAHGVRVTGPCKVSGKHLSQAPNDGDGVRVTGPCKVSGKHLSQAPNDGDLSEQDLLEIDTEFAQAKAADPYGQAAADRAQQDELHMLRCRGGL